jgi:hypothetical protein
VEIKEVGVWTSVLATDEIATLYLLDLVIFFLRVEIKEVGVWTSVLATDEIATLYQRWRRTGGGMAERRTRSRTKRDMDTTFS